MDDQPTTQVVKDYVNNALNILEEELRDSCTLSTDDHLSTIAVRRFMNNKLIVDNAPKREEIHERMRELANECLCMVKKYSLKHKEDKEMFSLLMKTEQVAAYAIEIKPALSIHSDKWG